MRSLQWQGQCLPSQWLCLSQYPQTLGQMLGSYNYPLRPQILCQLLYPQGVPNPLTFDLHISFTWYFLFPAVCSVTPFHSPHPVLEDVCSPLKFPPPLQPSYPLIDFTSLPRPNLTFHCVPRSHPLQIFWHTTTEVTSQKPSPSELFLKTIPQWLFSQISGKVKKQFLSTHSPILQHYCTEYLTSALQSSRISL